MSSAGIFISSETTTGTGKPPHRIISLSAVNYPVQRASLMTYERHKISPSKRAKSAKEARNCETISSLCRNYAKPPSCRKVYPLAVKGSELNGERKNPMMLNGKWREIPRRHRKSQSAREKGTVNTTRQFTVLCDDFIITQREKKSGKFPQFFLLCS